MISEVLPYLLMITCMLIQVSSKEVKWTVRDTSPTLRQDLTLFCEVDNCFENETKRWHGGPDFKLLMFNSGISVDKTKYNTAIEKNGFILTILNLSVEDLNVSYTCSCGFDLDKHMLYIEDMYKVDNLNRSTNGTNYVGTNDGRGKPLTIPLPITLAITILPFVLLIIVMKRCGSMKRLKVMLGGSQITKSDAYGNIHMRDPLLFCVDVKSNQWQSSGSSSLPSVGRGFNQIQDSGSSLPSFHRGFNQRRSSGSSLPSIHVGFNQRRGSDEDYNRNATEWLLFYANVESNQRRSLAGSSSPSFHRGVNQRRGSDEDYNRNVTDPLIQTTYVDSNLKKD